jgi:hypothetical protein
MEKIRQQRYQHEDTNGINNSFSFLFGKTEIVSEELPHK